MRNQAIRGRPKHDDVLTPAEWRVVHAVKHGLTSRAIAQSQGISVDAVKFHVANALGKLGLPDRKALRQWFEVPKNSHLRDQEVKVPESLGPIGQIARTVGSVERSQDWYQNVLGLAHLYTFGELAFFDCGGVRLALMQKNPVSDESIVYLRTDNIRAAHERLKSLGVEFISAPAHGSSACGWD